MDFVVCCMTHECVSGSIGLHCSTMSAKNETRVNYLDYLVQLQVVCCSSSNSRNIYTRRSKSNSH